MTDVYFRKHYGITTNTRQCQSFLGVYTVCPGVQETDYQPGITSHWTRRHRKPRDQVAIATTTTCNDDDDDDRVGQKVSLALLR